MEYLNDIIFNEASIYLGIIAIVMSVISLLTIIEQWILFNKERITMTKKVFKKCIIFDILTFMEVHNEQLS